jgi:hypothetical protein
MWTDVLGRFSVVLSAYSIAGQSGLGVRQMANFNQHKKNIFLERAYNKCDMGGGLCAVERVS